jgi:hypothetical protein
LSYLFSTDDGYKYYPQLEQREDFFQAGAALSLATPQHENDTSTTHSGIAQGTLDIRSNPGQDLSGLVRDLSTLDEIRFYKKTHATPKYDVMARRGDCGHDNWESSHSADKARKGIKRLEGRDNWALLNHCASCQGGGMWRVRW